MKNTEKSKISRDLFFHLTLLSILDCSIDPNQFLDELETLKKNVLVNGSINDNITDTARGLLSFHLLQYKDPILIDKMLEFIKQNSRFFYDMKFETHFDWKTNLVAFKIELRMLYWSLLVFSQYN